MPIAVVIVLSVFGVTSGGSIAATDTCAGSVFQPVLASLRAGTSVPLRLPLVMGDTPGAALYAEITGVSRTRYAVRIGQYCERSYCPYGRVSGTRISGRTRRPRGRVVELTNGVAAYLIDGSKKLKDSIITWEQGQYRYEIALYAAEPAVLIEAANSALSCGNP
ncbi:MAG TPA: hypothetical protein VM095_09805 [Pyrinomonadaceae bacterium]|nr:hypothetical protein [Pyrinomonadaceae bacterium]